ncbi:hypothetical protein BGX23_004873, partial [Mortierella sp. AD031]
AEFYWSQESRSSLAHYLTNNGWNVVVCPSEADIAIAADCQPKDIVVSGDSDMLIYDTVETVWRPLSRGRFLVYELAAVMDHLSISRAKLTTLGIVSKNDYSSNLTRLGISTNYKIVKSLDKTETDVQKLIQQYLVHPNVVCKNPSAMHFQPATKVFVHRMFSTPDSTMAPQTLGQESTSKDGAQQCRTLGDIFERLEALRLQLRESKKSTNDAGQAEEPRDVFNRYDTVDHPPGCRSRSHGSGRPYKYRQRYAIKTRSQLKKHDPPETMKQHQLKPWKSPPESPLDLSINTISPKIASKKPLRE